MDSKAAMGIGIAIGVAIVAITFAVLSSKISPLQVQSISTISSSNATISIIHGYISKEIDNSI